MAGEETGPERPTTDAFCVRCGGPDPVAHGECAGCLTEDLVVVKPPEKPVRVQVCRHCGATPVRESWREPTSLRELVERNAIGSLAVPKELEEMDLALVVEEHTRDAYTVTVEVSGVYKEVPVSSQVEVPVRIRGASCPACSKRHGGYFEAIVQVRQEGKGEIDEEQAGDIAVVIEEEVRKVGGLSGGQGYLLKAEHMHGGYDYYFGTQAVARAVARRLADRYAATISESSTIQGRRDGKDLYRLTLAVKIPEAPPGAIIGYDEEVLEVIKRQGNRILTRTVPQGEKRLLEERQFDRAVVLEPRTLDVVYAEGGEGQIMDPESYKTVEVRLPQEVNMGDQVEGVRFLERWFILGTAEG